MRRTVHISWAAVLAFTLLWLILMFTLLQGRILPASSKDTWANITNDRYGFSVEYPAEWVVNAFGERGSRGDTELKLEIYDTLLGTFRVFVYQRDFSHPTLQDVAKWGMTRIERANNNLSIREEPILHEIDFWESSRQGSPLLSRRYGNEQFTFEHVYIARSEDMIIIALQNDATAFDSSLMVFDRIVASFTSLQ